MKLRIALFVATVLIGPSVLAQPVGATDFMTMRRCVWPHNSNVLEASATVSCTTARHIAGEISYAPYRRREPYVFDRWSCFRAAMLDTSPSSTCAFGIGTLTDAQLAASGSRRSGSSRR
jgi:hypothetical protein